MKQRVLLDTGPLVALRDRRDRYHEWAKDHFAQIRPPLLTCEAVLTEACFLLRGLPGGGEAVLEQVRRGWLAIPFQVEREIIAVSQLMARYSSIPMSLADACLVRMAEQLADSIVLSLDQDFKLYRMHGRQVIPAIMPQR